MYHAAIDFVVIAILVLALRRISRRDVNYTVGDGGGVPDVGSDTHHSDCNSHDSGHCGGGDVGGGGH